MKGIVSFKQPGESDDLATILLKNLSVFQAFARNRLGDEQLAADAVQDSLLKAIKSQSDPADKENIMAWFYRILRNVITDLHRRQATRDRAISSYSMESETTSDGLKSFVCQCLHALIPAMEPAYAELIRRHDLDGETQEEIANDLGITRNNLKVRLHRARQQLRSLLEKSCTVCASHGCLDCDCDSAPHHKN